MKVRLQMMMLAVVCAVATGCRHKQNVAYVPLPVPTTVPLEKAPEPPLVAQVPVEPAPPIPAKTLPPRKIRKPRKKVVPLIVPAAPAPVQVASSGLAPAEAIGALSAGGETSPAKLQQATDLIAGLEKRITTLPTEWKTRQKDGLVRVRYFEAQAQVAIKGGDGEGAVTLATKAKLLLEDLVK